MPNDTIVQAAERLWLAAETQETCAPIRDLIGTTDLASAYAIQQINTEKRRKSGARVVGSKIGLTSPAVQQQLGVDQPDFGLLFRDMEVDQGLEMDYSLLMQPKVEAEIAFILGKDLTMEQPTSAEIMSAIDYAVASIEIVGSRIRDWDIRITDTIADNASASHFVLGHQPVKLEALDLVGCRMAMSVNGEQVVEGVGAACLGSPVNAVKWLAQTMHRIGTPLQAGDIILSGALGKMAPVSPGDSVVAQIEGLGSVSVSFSKNQ